MEVETFECTETAAEPIEASEEAIALIESLGLDGQRTLIATPENNPTTRMPYREITKEEMFVYGVLCPTKSKLKDYKATPIPLRVLQIAAHAQSLNEFETLEVWDRDSVLVKDPVLVGLRPNKQWSWQKDTYILARWGTELETFHVLLQRALEKKRQQVLQRLESVTSKAKMLLDNIDSLETRELIENGPEWQPQF
jgi:hypothetical protein